MLVGAVAAGWGAVNVMTGSSRATVSFGPGLSINAMTGGLIGLALLTIGLIWVRD